MSFYDEIGGEETFTRLVQLFYARVAHDELIGPMYPPDELPEAERRLRLFLTQYWGGPKTYGDERGHPRLRMRHTPFRIGAPEAERWLSHMRAALDIVIAETPTLDKKHEAELWEYLERAAYFMVNVDA